MHKFLSNLVLLSSSIILLFSIGLLLRLQAQTRVIYKDAEGQAKYASGTCQKDTDCAPAGCSKEICSSQKDLITACIVSSDYPNKNIYSCGCVSSSCAWFRK